MPRARTVWWKIYGEQVNQLVGNLLELKDGILRTLRSRGSIRYSISSSLKIFTISSTSTALLIHLSPMSWWFMVCESHTDHLILFMSSTSRITIIGDGYQWSLLLSTYLQKLYHYWETEGRCNKFWEINSHSGLSSMQKLTKN